MDTSLEGIWITRLREAGLKLAPQQELKRRSDQLSQLSWMLDEMFKVPGLNWRFGLDSLIGLVPGAGDLTTATVSLLILFRAMQSRLPAVVIARMVLNTLIDMLVGAIPFAGDLFDFAWKSNSMNMKLFLQYAREPTRPTWRQWLFIVLIALLFLGTFALVSVGTYLVLRELF